MKYLYCKFSTSLKEYLFCAEDSVVKDIKIDGMYTIRSVGGIDYDKSPVKVTKIFDYEPWIKDFPYQIVELETIKPVPISRRKTQRVVTPKRIWYNTSKRIMVVKWTDDIVTKLHVDPRDTFDAQKGIALAYMKRAFGNKSRFNEILKEIEIEYH